MALATALNVSLWLWAAPAWAQSQAPKSGSTAPSTSAAQAWDHTPLSPQLARLVVYRTAQDELPAQALVRINGSYLANLPRAGLTVVCLPPQVVLLQSMALLSTDEQEPVTVSVSLEGGQTRFILLSDAPNRALVMYGLTAEHAQPDLLDARVVARTRNRFQQAKPCVADAQRLETAQMAQARGHMDSAERVALAREQ